MAEETIDPGLLEQTKNQIRKLVGEIAELAESDVQPNEFYAEFMNRAVAAVAASGGALWLLDGKGVAYEEHDLSLGGPKKAEMIERASGRSTFPQIFIDGVHVGGCDDLHALDDEGKLDRMLAA